MPAVTMLLSVLVVVVALFCGVGIWALLEGVKTAKSVRVLADDLDARLVPLLDKADVTVDAFNAELLRVDAIVTRFEEISDRVETTSRTVQEVANAPVEIVTDFADRVRRAWKSRRGAPDGYGPGDSESPEPSGPTVVVDDASADEPAADLDAPIITPATTAADFAPATDSEENRAAHAQ